MGHTMQECNLGVGMLVDRTGRLRTSLMMMRSRATTSSPMSSIRREHGDRVCSAPPSISADDAGSQADDPPEPEVDEKILDVIFDALSTVGDPNDIDYAKVIGLAL